MERDGHNLSTDYQPKGSDRDPSDTLDKPVGSDDKVGQPTDRSPKSSGTAPVVDEKGRPLSGDGHIA